jgi:exonuclease VII small subunit
MLASPTTPLSSIDEVLTVAPQDDADKAIAKLQALTSKARIRYLQHTGDADGGNRYLKEFEDLANALDALELDALSAAIGELQNGFDQIADATKRLDGALDQIAAGEAAFAEFSRIVEAGAGLITALQDGDLQAIKDAIDHIRTTFAAPADGG